MIRRAVALPIGLLDRIEASLDAALDAGFARVDRALNRRISSVADRASSLSQGLARSVDSVDRALDQQVTKSQARTAAHAAKAHATVDRIGTGTRNLEARTDARLNRSLH